MRRPLITRRRHEHALDRAHRKAARAVEAARLEHGFALRQLAHQLDIVKDIAALHIVAAGQPSTTLHDARAMATSLEQSLTAAGIDMRIELDRERGTQL